MKDEPALPPEAVRALALQHGVIDPDLSSVEDWITDYGSRRDELMAFAGAIAQAAVLAERKSGKQLLRRLVMALEGVLPMPLTGDPDRETLLTFWKREQELGRGEAIHVLFAYDAIDRAEALIRSQEG